MGNKDLLSLQSVLTRVAAQCGQLGIPFAGLYCYSHVQVWPNTGCGFGGIVGQAFTDAHTIVLVESSLVNTLYVFHGGQFAYKLKDPNDKFFEDWKSNKLLGQSDNWEEEYGKKG